MNSAFHLETPPVITLQRARIWKKAGGGGLYTILQFIVLLQTVSTKKRGDNQVEIHPQFLDFQRMFIRG